MKRKTFWRAAALWFAQLAVALVSGAAARWQTIREAFFWKGRFRCLNWLLRMFGSGAPVDRNKVSAFAGVAAAQEYRLHREAGDGLFE